MTEQMQIRTTSDLAYAMRAAREDAGLTQTDVARALGVAQPLVSEMESELLPPTRAVSRLLQHLSTTGATLTISWGDDAAGG